MLKLTKLTYLDLSYNELTSIISFTTIASLPATNIVIGYNPTQETAICDIVAATNIGSIYAEWSCTSDHQPSSEVCDWPGVNDCNSGVVTVLLLDATALTGMLLIVLLDLLSV